MFQGFRFYIISAFIVFSFFLISSCGGSGSGYYESGSWTGVKQLGVIGAETVGYSVATDTNGNVYVAGTTDGDLDGNTLTGIRDFFVTKYDRNGEKLYTRQLGVTGTNTHGRSVTTDANGNVYVAGFTYGDLDGNTLSGHNDTFLIKFNSNGEKQYTKLVGVGGSSTNGYSVATDSAGNVYVAGYTDGGLDGNTLYGISDFFLTKYDSNGVKQYTRQLGVAGSFTIGCSVTIDANGNVYVAGNTDGDLDGNTLSGVIDFFVTKYDSSGVKQYTRQLGVTGSISASNSVATDANGNVYVAGDTDGDLDGNTLSGFNDFFVTKYDSSGVKQYTRQLGTVGPGTYGTSVATDVAGNVYVEGYTYGNLDGNTLTGISDFFVTKYDSSGVKQYTQQLGATGANTIGYSVATDGSSNVYVAGYTDGDLDGNTLSGVYDFFVAKGAKY